MTPDLKLLVWSVALVFVEIMVAALAANGQVGLPAQAGNRDAMPVLTGFAGRAQRAYRNMLETLPIFIALVVAAQLAGKADATTLFGCQLYFWGRIAHWVIYLIGIPWLRTLAWLVSIVGLILIFQQVA